MNTAGEDGSPVLAHYATGYEAERLNSGPGQLERIRTQEILARYLPPPPALIADIGGGPATYATWLAARGQTVQLLDVVPLHVEQARQRFQADQLENARAELGDARALPYGSESQDIALLLGPLYHLPEHEDRRAALREAWRVLKPGGLLVAAVISRYASLLDGFFSGFVRDPLFAGIIERDLHTGWHENPSDNLFYFTTAYFHRPEDVRPELEESGFSATDLVGVEGPFWCLDDLEEIWLDDDRREQMLGFLRRVEGEPSLLGASAHLLATGRKPDKLSGYEFTRPLK